MKNQQSIGIYFWLLLVPLFWGATFVAVKNIVTEIPPVTAATIRFGAAGIILLIYVLIRENFDFRVIKKQWNPLVLMAVTGTFGYNIFFFIGSGITSAINGSLIMATTPVFLTLGAVLFLGETWNKQLGFGLTLSLLGVIVVISQGSLATILGLKFNVGDLLFIGALLCWIAHGLLGKIVMRDISPAVVTTITILAGSILLGAVSFFEKGWGDVLHMSTQGWVKMLFITVCASAVAYLLWNHGIKQIGASKVSVYMNFVPINTAWVAVLIYGSSITLAQIFGMIMVVIGVYFVTLHQFVVNKRIRVKQ